MDQCIGGSLRGALCNRIVINAYKIDAFEKLMKTSKKPGENDETNCNFCLQRFGWPGNCLKCESVLLDIDKMDHHMAIATAFVISAQDPFILTCA